jgi:multiple sugar transport system substrate-binding protein
LSLSHSTVDGNFVQIPIHSDFSNLLWIEDLYDETGNQKNFKAKLEYDLTPSDTWKKLKDHAIFFMDPPNSYRTQFVEKNQAISGYFYEMLVGEGGQFLNEKMEPAFNSKTGEKTPEWLVDLHKANALPKRIPN